MPIPNHMIPDGGDDGSSTVSLDTEQIQAVASQFHTSSNELSQVAATLDKIFAVLIHFDEVIPDHDLQRTLSPLIDQITSFHTDIHTSITNMSAWVNELSLAQAAIATDHASIEQGATDGHHGPGPIPQ